MSEVNLIKHAEKVGQGCGGTYVQTDVGRDILTDKDRGRNRYSTAEKEKSHPRVK